MNLLKSPVRRATAVLAGAVLGMAGAVALAAPASAHHTTVNVGSRCQNADGSWQVEWHVLNSEDDIEGVLSAVETDPNIAIPGIAVGTILPRKGQGVAKGIQQLPANVTSSTLKVKGHWERGGQSVDDKDWVSNSFDKPKKKCDETPPPSASASPSPEPSASPSSPPASPSTSPSASPSPSPSTTPGTPGEPTPVVDADCDSITLGLDNPANGVEVKLDFKTSKGETRTLTIAPGEKKSEKFSATTGFKVTITITIGGESATEVVTYEKPENCGGAGGGDEPTLPLTGAAAGGIAGGAALLLAVGAFLFVMARRRKVKFTA